MLPQFAVFLQIIQKIAIFVVIAGNTASFLMDFVDAFQFPFSINEKILSYIYGLAQKFMQVFVYIPATNTKTLFCIDFFDQNNIRNFINSHFLQVIIIDISILEIEPATQEDFISMFFNNLSFESRIITQELNSKTSSILF